MSTKLPIRIYLDPPQLDYLQKLAKANACSLSQVIRTLLIEHARSAT